MNQSKRGAIHLLHNQFRSTTLYDRTKTNTPPEVEGAKAEAEPARAARTASFIMVSVVASRQECKSMGGDKVLDALQRNTRKSIYDSSLSRDFQRSMHNDCLTTVAQYVFSQIS